MLIQQNNLFLFPYISFLKFKLLFPFQIFFSSSLNSPIFDLLFTFLFSWQSQHLLLSFQLLFLWSSHFLYFRELWEIIFYFILLQSFLLRSILLNYPIFFCFIPRFSFEFTFHFSFFILSFIGICTILLYFFHFIPPF